MRIEKSRLIWVLKNCYRKFKSYIFFSHSQEYIKIKLSSFECSDIDGIFSRLADAIIDEEWGYFNQLLSQIKAKPFIKKIEDKKKKDDNVISNILDTSNDLVVEKLNFFIDQPIELSVIDVFWALLFGQIATDNPAQKYWWANRLSPSLYKSRRKSRGDAIDGIDFKTLDIFTPYYPDYVKWKNTAIGKAQELHKQKSDATIVSIDLTRYFYSIDVDWGLIRNAMEKRYQEYDCYSFLTDVVENIYRRYSEALRYYDLQIPKDRIVLPIGLISSNILGNYLLSDVDLSIKAIPSVASYGRYVDDILITIQTGEEKNFGAIVKRFLSDVFVQDKEMVDDVIKYNVSGHSSLSIQSDKTKIIVVSKSGSAQILEKIRKEIRPSEPRLFPSYAIDVREFLSDISVTNDSLKIREVSPLSLNVAKLSRAISGYITLGIGCEERALTKDNQKIKGERITNDRISQFLSLLPPETLFSISSRWNKLFVLFGLLKNPHSITSRVERNINNSIRRLRISTDLEIGHGKALLSELKKTYATLLLIAQATVRASFGIKKNRKTRKREKELNNLAQQLRETNLFDHSIVAIPLTNYLCSIKPTENYYTLRLTDLANRPEAVLDISKCFYSPRFIHLGDYMFLRQLLGFGRSNEYSVDAFQMIDDYNRDIGSIFGCEKVPVERNNRLSSSKSYIRETFEVFSAASQRIDMEELYIGIVNYNLMQFKHISKNGALVIPPAKKSRKKAVISLLNDCFLQKAVRSKSKRRKGKNQQESYQKRPVSYLAFPELFLPIHWIPLLTRYSLPTGAVCISGIDYIRIKKRIFNTQVVVIPYQDKNGHRENMVFLREKNNYAPSEKEAIHKAKYYCVDHQKPIYQSFVLHDINFTSFICYELTDLYARSLLRNPHTDLLFALEFNFDIRYFTNIAESACRDLFCFVTQVNSSDPGDSKIIAPYRDKFKILAAITKGEKPSVHIGAVNLKGLRNYIDAYLSHGNDLNYSKLKENPEFFPYKKPSAGFEEDK